MKVVHCKKEKFDVYIGRPGIWGNPFSLDKYTRTEAIEKYREWIKTQPDLLKKLPELKGKTLGCWCKPKECHGDVLIELANKPTYDPLLYGKAGIDRIINMEVVGDTIELFRLKEDHSIETIVRPFKYWILSHKQEGKGWVRLNGDLHYKWGKQFSDPQDFYNVAKYLYRSDIFVTWDAKESAMLKDGYSHYLGLKPSDLPILSFDLETTSLDPEHPDAKILLISNTFRKNGTIVRKLFSYDDYESQADMITDWANWVFEMDPSVICGHNIFSFDFKYLLGIAEREGIDICIGRDGSPLKQKQKETKFRVDGSRDLHYKKIRCFGRELIDTMFLAYRYDIVTKKYDSYGLKPIIKAEGLEKKDRAFYDASQIRFKYTDPVEWIKIKEYCRDDADDSLALFDLMSPAYFYMTQSIPRSFQQVHESATGAHINGIMVRSYLQEKHSLPKGDQSTEFEGALSDGFPGIYRNCVKWDVSSLYPSIMRQYKVYDKDKDPKGNFLRLTEYFATERLKNKKLAKQTGDKYYDDLQSAQKIFANSMYGFLAAPGLNFNSLHNASFITQKGREFLQKAVIWATGKPYEPRNL